MRRHATTKATVWSSDREDVVGAPISVCIPAYRAERFLRDTMRSVLAQDFDGELLVLDNASDDATRAIATSFAAADPRVRVISNQRVLSIDQNWNHAVSSARFDLVKVVCADDVLRPGALASQAAIMAEPDVAVCSSRFEVIDEAGAVVESDLGIPGLLGCRPAGDVARFVVRRGPADFGPTAATMFRKTHFDAVGGFRQHIFSMDVDLFARMTSRGSFVGHSDITAAWRMSRYNLSSQTSTLSKLLDMFLAQHQIRADHPSLVSACDVAVGDIRLIQAALARLVFRARLVRQRRA